MMVRCLVVTMMTAVAGPVWAQSPPAPPSPPEQLLVAAVDAQPPAPARPPSAPTPRPPATARGVPPPDAPAAPAPPAPPAPQREGQAINVKIEVTITDQHTGSAPTRKTLTAVIGDGLQGSVRSNVNLNNLGLGEVPLNLDAGPTILTDGKIRLRFSLQYDLPGPSSSVAARTDASLRDQPQKMSIRETMALILESGKPIVASQSADPVSDRQVTVEVKATILR